MSSCVGLNGQVYVIKSIFILNTYDTCNLYPGDPFAIFGMLLTLSSNKGNPTPCSPPPACLSAPITSYQLFISALDCVSGECSCIIFCPRCLWFPQPGPLDDRCVGFVLLHILFQFRVVILWRWSFSFYPYVRLMKLVSLQRHHPYLLTV